ncbi:hypothetical protein JKP88DRAFT_181897, partial [Tribonema minus]
MRRCAQPAGEPPTQSARSVSAAPAPRPHHPAHRSRHPGGSASQARRRLACRVDLRQIKDDLALCAYKDADALCAAIADKCGGAKEGAGRAALRIELESFRAAVGEAVKQKREEHDKTEPASKCAIRCGACARVQCVVCGERCCVPFAPQLSCCRCSHDIKNGGMYWAAPDGQRLWCGKCYEYLDEVIP